MILSVSRRTDIPRFYFDWFLNRLTEGYALVRNPMNFHQVSRITLSPDVVDCIVFWTKNPKPMLEKLDRIAAYPYYVQFTVNPYGREIEGNLPAKNELTDTFKRLSEQLGPERTVWRYSPVLINETYTEAFHVDFFSMLAERLSGYTEQCKLSFIDLYAKIKKRMAALGVGEIPQEQKNRLAQQLFKIAAGQGIAVSACGTIDLAAAGVPPAKCIDDALISRITGYPFHLKKDPGQRGDCYCVSSVDIGAYDTCGNGCAYCYANDSGQAVTRNCKQYDPASPLLCGSLMQGDKVTERAVKSWKEKQTQMRLF